MAEPESVETSVGLFAQIWASFRPYLVMIVVDFLITTTLWVVLFSFKLLTESFAIEGFAGKLIVNIHGAGAVSAFIVFGSLFAFDLYSLHRHSGSHQKDK